MIVIRDDQGNLLFIGAPAIMEIGPRSNGGWELFITQYVGGGTASNAMAPRPAMVYFHVANCESLDRCRELRDRIQDRLPIGPVVF